MGLMDERYKEIKDILEQNGLLQNDMLAVGYPMDPVTFFSLLKDATVFTLGTAIVAAATVLPDILNLLNFFMMNGEDKGTVAFLLVNGEFVLITFKGGSMVKDAAIRVNRKDVKDVFYREPKHDTELVFVYNDGKEVEYRIFEPSEAVKKMVTKFYNP